jgi:hypothetical protein
MLNRLVAREGIAFLYTHLGKVTSREEPLGAGTRQALRLLARYHKEGLLLVTTTRRLLGHCRAIREVTLSTTTVGKNLVVDVILPPGARWRAGDLDGLTMYVPRPERTRVTVGGREVTSLRRNDPDHTGRSSVSLPWSRLEFPAW